MIDLFDYLYYLLTKDNKKTLLWKVMRYVVRKVANITLPIYFILTRNNSQYKLQKFDNKHPQVILSLTSFPTRIKDLWKVIESLLRQSVKPDRMILWLSEDQFQSINDVPHSLLKLRERGLEIEIRKGDLRSHKKYYYTFKEHPNDICIIVDDDIFYRSNLLETLISLHKKYPNSICFNHGRTILNNKGVVLSYEDGEPLKPTSVPSLSNSYLAVGVGGVLYPPRSTSEEVLNEDIFKQICYKADDIWLWAMTYLNRTGLVYSGLEIGFIPVQIKNNQTLCSSNNDGGNTEQFNNVMQYYSL